MAIKPRELNRQNIIKMTKKLLWKEINWKFIKLKKKHKTKFTKSWAPIIELNSCTQSTLSILAKSVFSAKKTIYNKTMNSTESEDQNVSLNTKTRP